MALTHATRHEIRTLEQQLATPGATTRADLGRLLAPEFREFGSSGKTYDADAVIATGGAGGGAVELEGFQVERVATNVVLATYVARPSGGGSERPATLRSSLWRRTNGRWQLVFHQGTPLAPSAAR